MRVRQTAVQIVRAQVHWHICMHLHCCILFSVSRKKGFQSRVHFVEPRVQLCVPKEETFPIPPKYIDITRTTDTTLDVRLEKSVDDCLNVDGDRDLSDTWSVFTKFTLLNEKTPKGFVLRGAACKHPSKQA